MLPKLGLGLSTNLGDDQAFRLRSAGHCDFIEYSAPLSLPEARAEAPLFERLRDQPALFHPVHLNLYGPELEAPDQLAALEAQLREVGSPWVGNDVAWWHHRGTPFPGYLYLAPPLTEAGLQDCVVHARHVQGAVSVPLLLENPVVQERNGPLHVLDFMARLHAQTGCGLILDLGHLLAHQLAAGLPLRAGLDGFPLEAVGEIHLAGGVVTGRAYADDHTQPVREELFELLAELAPRCPDLAALTFEGDGQPEGVVRATLERLRAFAPIPTLAGPRPERRPGTPAAPFVPASDAWQLFDRARGCPVPSPDPAGTRADVDYRLAVLAAALDRAWPLTRLLLCPSREALLAFSTSPEYRAVFEGRSLEQGFGAFARRGLREQPDEAVERSLAFEAWARALAAPAASPSASNGWREGTFPVDLGELCFAAQALRRHLAGRALATGAFEASGFVTLAQVARRAPARPWRVQVRQSAAGLEVRTA